MENIKLHGRILVLIPHPDDEVILFGGLIQRAQTENCPVYVALVTNGDYEASTEEEGRIRPAETLDGLSVLGLPESRVILMGYADIGMKKKESFLYRLYAAENEKAILPSHVGTNTYGLDFHADFHRELHGEPAPYTREAFREDLKELVKIVDPDMIFTTHPRDAHGDHAGLSMFVAELAPRAAVYAGFTHAAQGDSAWPLAGDYFTCPPGLEEEWETAARLDLTEEEQRKKGMALEMHKAALKPDAVDYLHSFVKREEVYIPMEASR